MLFGCESSSAIDQIDGRVERRFNSVHSGNVFHVSAHCAHHVMMVIAG